MTKWIGLGPKPKLNLEYVTSLYDEGIQKLEDEDQQVKLEGIFKIERSMEYFGYSSDWTSEHTEGAIQPLIDALEGDPMVVGAAGELLAELALYYPIDDDIIVDRLFKALRKPNPAILRVGAATALAELWNRLNSYSGRNPAFRVRALVALSVGLGDELDDVFFTARWALDRAGPAERRVLAVLDKHVLGTRTGFPDEISEILEKLLDPDWFESLVASLDIDWDSLSWRSCADRGIGASAFNSEYRDPPVGGWY